VPAEALEHQVTYEILASLPTAGVGVLGAITLDVDLTAVIGDDGEVDLVSVDDGFGLHGQACFDQRRVQPPFSL